MSITTDLRRLANKVNDLEDWQRSVMSCAMVAERRAKEEGITIPNPCVEGHDLLKQLFEAIGRK